MRKLISREGAVASATKVTFVNDCGVDLIVLVFWGSTDGVCQDKPHRRNFTLPAGKSEPMDIGVDPICYCYNPIPQGVPGEDCLAQRALPGDSIHLH